MEESAKKSTGASNLEKMSPEKRTKLEEFRAELDQCLVEALKQGIEKDQEEWDRLMEARKNKKDSA